MLLGMKFSFFLFSFLVFAAGVGFAQSASKIEKEFQKINEEMKTLEREIHANNLGLYKAQKELKKLDEKEAQLRKHWVGDVQNLNQAVLHYIRLQRLPQNALFTADIFSGQSHREKVITYSQGDLSNQIQSNKKELTALMKNYAAKHQEMRKMEVAKSAQVKKRRSLLEKQQEKINLMKITDKSRAALMEKAAKIARARTMDDIFSKNKLGGQYVPKGGSTHPNLPVMGKVTRHFHQQTSSGLQEQGITILTAPAANVQALQDGRVIYSGPFREYGYLLIMEHAEGLHTVYGGITPTQNLQVGDFVTTGQFVGRMGAVEKPLMYLEVRRNGEPINPMRILR